MPKNIEKGLKGEKEKYDYVEQKRNEKESIEKRKVASRKTRRRRRRRRREYLQYSQKAELKKFKEKMFTGNTYLALKIKSLMV